MLEVVWIRYPPMRFCGVEHLPMRMYPLYDLKKDIVMGYFSTEIFVPTFFNNFLFEKSAFNQNKKSRRITKKKETIS